MDSHFMFDNCGGCDCTSQFEVKFGNITGLGVGPLAKKDPNRQGRTPHASAAAGGGAGATMQIPAAAMPKAAHPATVAANTAVLEALPFDDTRDFVS